MPLHVLFELVGVFIFHIEYDLNEQQLSLLSRGVARSSQWELSRTWPPEVATASLAQQSSDDLQYFSCAESSVQPSSI